MSAQERVTTKCALLLRKLFDNPEDASETKTLEELFFPLPNSEETAEILVEAFRRALEQYLVHRRNIYSSLEGDQLEAAYLAGLRPVDFVTTTLEMVCVNNPLWACNGIMVGWKLRRPLKLTRVRLEYQQIWCYFDKQLFGFARKTTMRSRSIEGYSEEGFEQMLDLPNFMDYDEWLTDEQRNTIAQYRTDYINDIDAFYKAKSGEWFATMTLEEYFDMVWHRFGIETQWTCHMSFQQDEFDEEFISKMTLHLFQFVSAEECIELILKRKVVNPFTIINLKDAIMLKRTQHGIDYIKKSYTAVLLNKGHEALRSSRYREDFVESISALDELSYPMVHIHLNDCEGLESVHTSCMEYLRSRTGDLKSNFDIESVGEALKKLVQNDFVELE